MDHMCRGRRSNTPASGSSARMLARLALVLASHWGFSDAASLFSATVGSSALPVYVLLLLVGVALGVLLWCTSHDGAPPPVCRGY